MQRRPFLRLAVGAAATTAGCVGALGSPDASSAGTDAATARMAAADGEAPALSVSGVETFDHVVRLNDLGDDPAGGVTEFSALRDREREVVRAAIDGAHRTGDPPEWLCEFASGTRFVEREGTYFRLDDTLPTWRVTAEAVPASEVSGEIATYEEYEAAVSREDYVATGLLRVARREGLELEYVWPALREFFGSYDAARYHGEVVSFSVAVEDPGPPYRISATEASVSEAVGGSVWNAGAAPEETRELVRRAARTRGSFGFDGAPPGLLDALRAHRYVRLDGTFYTSYVEADGSVPVSAVAEIRDGRLRLSLRNEADAALRLSSGPPRPFGVVRCHPAGDDSTRDLLWTDAYAESDYVETNGRAVGLVNDVALTSTVAPGESVGESYAVPDDLPIGEYVVEGSVGASREDAGDDSSTVRYRVTFSVG